MKEKVMADHKLALGTSVLSYIKVSGKTMAERTQPLNDWANARRSLGVWPFSRVLIEPALHHTIIGDENGLDSTRGINFSSQDYLGLANRQEMKDAARAAIDQFGVHSAGSPALCGRTSITVQLEEKIASILGFESSLIYPTGWAAGFGVVTGLVREADTIFIDALCHNCLQEGAKFATKNLRKFNHNDLTHLAELLKEERSNNAQGAIFIITETLFSMDSDSPDLNAFINLAITFEAILILDVAHDFGAMGKHGRGLIDSLNIPNWQNHVVVMGSFSKTFASNGGFVACHDNVRQYLRCFSSTQFFSNAISPIQTLVVLNALRLVFSYEGDSLRAKLMSNIDALRSSMKHHSLDMAGIPSPIVPVFVGVEKNIEATARLTSKHLIKNQLHANLVEFPAVPRGKARFRFQVMATHLSEEIKQASLIMSLSRHLAIEELAQLKIN